MGTHRVTEGTKTHRRFAYSLDFQILREAEGQPLWLATKQADLGLWGITKVGIKYLIKPIQLRKQQKS